MPLTAAERAAHGPEWVKRVEACPNERNHTYGPAGYLAWHDWAEARMKTHNTFVCNGCGLYLVYEEKGAR